MLPIADTLLHGSASTYYDFLGVPIYSSVQPATYAPCTYSGTATTQQSPHTPHLAAYTQEGPVVANGKQTAGADLKVSSNVLTIWTRVAKSHALQASCLTVLKQVSSLFGVQHFNWAPSASQCYWFTRNTTEARSRSAALCLLMETLPSGLPMLLAIMP